MNTRPRPAASVGGFTQVRANSNTPAVTPFPCLCASCRRPLPVPSSPDRLTCSDRCRTRLSRLEKRQRAYRRFVEKYPEVVGMGLMERFAFDQERAHRAWLAQQERRGR
jgi:predicted nucleic acid-binding Zn ribbon protein